MGATCEPGVDSNPKDLRQMQSINSTAPEWLKDSFIIQQWKGVRGKPINRPAPILENLEPGLIIAIGHYRNGVLLAPASAKWVAKEISKDNKNKY